GDDLVGVDVGPVQRDSGSFDGLYSFHVFPSGQVRWGGEVAGDGGGGGDGGGDEASTSTSALAAFEVAIGCRGTALARGELVGVHGQAHRTARLAPVETGLDEDFVQTLGLGRFLHFERTGHDHGPVDGDLAALGDGGRGTQIFD